MLGILFFCCGCPQRLSVSPIDGNLHLPTTSNSSHTHPQSTIHVHQLYVYSIDLKKLLKGCEYNYKSTTTTTIKNNNQPKHSLTFTEFFKKYFSSSYNLSKYIFSYGGMVKILLNKRLIKVA